jgi:hypothetical protein
MFGIYLLQDLMSKKGNDNVEGYWIKYKREATDEVEQVFIGEVQYLFLHVPKTGGTYVARNKGVLTPIFDMNHAVLAEMPYTGNPDYPPTPGYSSDMRMDISLVNKPYRLCFATVRNPYDWFVSYWFHVKADPLNPDYIWAQKGFDSFVRMLAEKNTGWPSNRQLLYFAFFSYEGNFIVDRLIHQENLDTELDEFANESKDLWYQKSDNKPKVSIGRNLDYRPYYSDPLVELVKKVWGRDLYLFGYDYENGKVRGIFDKVIDNELKNKVKYIWDTDKLILD